MANGATLIEKHFTIDKNLPGPGGSNILSLEPDEFQEMARNIRITESSMGSGIKSLTEEEIQVRSLPGEVSLLKLISRKVTS